MVPANKLLRWGAICAGFVLTVMACGGSSTEDDASTRGAAGATGSGGASGGAGGSAGSTSGGGTGGASGSTSGGGGAGGSTVKCHSTVYGPGKLVYVDYDKYGGKMNSTCSGTNHQDIQNPEKLVFLGDSITEGSPPTPANQFYRQLLTDMAKAKWPSIEVANCSAWGAQTDDFFGGDNQIPKCFPAAEPKKTLVVITMGGNDVAAMAKDKLSFSAAKAESDKVLVNMKKAVDWLKDSQNFPNGSWVVFANIYEYTGLTADLSSCPAGNLLGLTGSWEVGTSALVQLREGYMKIAVDAKADMIFMGEHFCGHGYKYNDTKSQCYIPNSSNWFDITCIHPTPAGHKEVADLFWKTISE
ncbi:MAG: SGNH/GDSL hydrolase family protein [Myxococcales bacterium]|nr:SGNH/GDSL hydrolase family protein [Myxococcales bacterium]